MKKINYSIYNKTNSIEPLSPNPNRPPPFWAGGNYGIIWLQTGLCYYLWIEKSAGVSTIDAIAVQSIVWSRWEVEIDVWRARLEKDGQ